MKTTDDEEDDYNFLKVPKTCYMNEDDDEEEDNDANAIANISRYHNWGKSSKDRLNYKQYERQENRLRKALLSRDVTIREIDEEVKQHGDDTDINLISNGSQSLESTIKSVTYVSWLRIKEKEQQQTLDLSSIALKGTQYGVRYVKSDTSSSHIILRYPWGLHYIFASGLFLETEMIPVTPITNEVHRRTLLFLRHLCGYETLQCLERQCYSNLVVGKLTYAINLEQLARVYPCVIYEREAFPGAIIHLNTDFEPDLSLPFRLDAEKQFGIRNILSLCSTAASWMRSVEDFREWLRTENHYFTCIIYQSGAVLCEGPRSSHEITKVHRALFPLLSSQHEPDF